MNYAEKLKGVFPPVPTIVDQQGNLDKKGMGTLIDKLIHDGVNGMLFLGSGGEFCHMSKEQRFEVAEFVVAHVNQRIPILIGISSTSTEEAIEFGLHADSLGVDGALLLNPYYALLSDEYIYNHFKLVAQSIETPVLIYNFPALTGQDIKVDLLARLASEVPNIIGLKDTVDNISHLREVINIVRPIRPDFVIFAGFDEYMMDSLILGANGGIPATCNFAPQITCGIYKAFLEKNYEKMFELQRQLARLSSIYTLDTPFFGIIKEAIRLSGLDISTEVLPPVQKPNESKKTKLKQLLHFSELLKTA